jgi:hypothetical protein
MVTGTRLDDPATELGRYAAELTDSRASIVTFSTIPAGLDLRMFAGAALAVVHVHPFTLDLAFVPDDDWSRLGPGLRIEDRWELRDAAGALVDGGHPGADGHGGRAAPQVTRLLTRVVVGTEVAAPAHFTLAFAGGHTLRVFAESGYEAFTIWPAPAPA